MKIARYVLPANVTYESRYADPSALFANAIEFDRRMLGSLDKSVWDSVATSLMQRITDPVIDNALRTLPPEYASISPRLAAKIKARRDGLRDAADLYYRELWKVADVHGTEADDQATVVRSADGIVDVRIQSGSDAPQLLSLRGQWKSADAELGSAKQELGRVEKLVATGSVSSAELDRARARVAELEGALAANEAQQRALRIDLSANAERHAANVQSLASRVLDTEVRAPLDGVVLTKLVEVGEVVGVNQPLFKIGDTKNLVLEVSVDEADIGKVRDGISETPVSIVAVSLYAFPKQVFAARVFEVLPDANRERKAFLVKVRFDAPPLGLRSGMSAEVNIIAGQHDNALLADTGAISEDALWVVVGGRAEHRGVKVGVRDLLRAEILSGVAEGDLVVTAGYDGLTEGARVTPTSKTPDKFEAMPDVTQPPQTSLR